MIAIPVQQWIDTSNMIIYVVPAYPAAPMAADVIPGRHTPSTTDSEETQFCESGGASTLSPSQKRRARRRRATATKANAPAMPGTTKAAGLSTPSSSDGGLDVDACEEAIADLGGTPDEHNGAVALLCSHFRELAFDARGCRTAQAALDAARKDVQVALAAELRGHVLEAVESPHANFVLQKLVEELPPEGACFVVEAFSGVAACYAKHHYAIRVLCRVIEHFPPEFTEGLLAEVLQEVAALCKNAYGHCLVRHILEHGTAEHKAAVFQALLDDVLGIAEHVHGSLVVEDAFLHLESKQRRALLSALVDDTGSFIRLASSRYGCFVAKALLELRDSAESAKVTTLLALASESLKATKHGWRVLTALAEKTMR